MDRTIATVATTLTIVLVSGFVVLAWSGRDTAGYVLFVAGPVVSTVVGVVLARKVSTIGSDVTTVKHQTNQMLTTRLDSLDSQLSAAAADRSAIATVETAAPAAAGPAAQPGH